MIKKIFFSFLVLFMLVIPNEYSFALNEPDINDKIEDFHNKVFIDIVKSFSLKIDEYNKIITSEEMTNFIGNNSSMIPLIGNACLKNGCIGKPIVLVKDNEGMILFKESNGSNSILKIERKIENRKWVIIDKLETQGSTLGIYD